MITDIYTGKYQETIYKVRYFIFLVVLFIFKIRAVSESEQKYDNLSSFFNYIRQDRFYENCTVDV